MTRLTNLEIAEETIKYYSEDPNRRGYDTREERCVYLLKSIYDPIDENDKKCAVGRMIDWDMVAEYGIRPEELNELGSVDDVFNSDLFETKGISLIDILKEKYKNVDYNLLKNLQFYHDSYITWTDKEEKEKREKKLISLAKSLSL